MCCSVLNLKVHEKVKVALQLVCSELDLERLVQSIVIFPVIVPITIYCNPLFYDGLQHQVLALQDQGSGCIFGSVLYAQHQH